MERLNKKAQGLSLTTIILIVLGLAVLIFLIFGFSRGWGNLWDTASNIGGGDANVDDVKRGCTLACDTQSEDAYCREVREVRFGDGTWEKGSCKTFESYGKEGIRLSRCSDVTCAGITVPGFDSSEKGAVSTKAEADAFIAQCAAAKGLRKKEAECVVANRLEVAPVRIPDATYYCCKV